MMNFTSELSEFTAESKFTWKVKNFKDINWKRHNFVIESKAIKFEEASAVWTLKLTPFSYSYSSLFLISKFCLKTDVPDVNAMFKFDIILKGKKKVLSCKNINFATEFWKLLMRLTGYNNLTLFFIQI